MNSARGNEVVAAIENAELARCRILRSADWAALAETLSDDFEYTHGSGLTVDKDEWVRSLAGSQRSIDWEEFTVRPLADSAALAAGKLLYTIEERGNPARVVKLAVLQAWTLRDQRWLLVAQHGTVMSRDR